MKIIRLLIYALMPMAYPTEVDEKPYKEILIDSWSNASIQQKAESYAFSFWNSLLYLERWDHYIPWPSEIIEEAREKFEGNDAISNFIRYDMFPKNNDGSIQLGSTSLIRTAEDGTEVFWDDVDVFIDHRSGIAHGRSGGHRFESFSFVDEARKEYARIIMMDEFENNRIRAVLIVSGEEFAEYVFHGITILKIEQSH